jgi:hypothetical protein
MYRLLGERGLANSESFVGYQHEHSARPTDVVLRDGARCSGMVRISRSQRDTQDHGVRLALRYEEYVLG